MSLRFPFSSRTLGVLTEAIDAGYADRRIGTLILKAEADSWAPRSWPNKQTRVQMLFQRMRDDGSEGAAKAALEVVRLILRDGSRDRDTPTIWYQEVRSAAAADGWEYDSDSERLVPTVSGMEVVEETTFLENEMEDHGWDVAAGHYRQALEAFGARNWASANAQLRSMLEDLLRACAEHVSGTSPKDAQACLDVLRKDGVLLDGEFGFAKGLWSLCQSRGSHPGLSSEDEARFRLIVVTSYGRFLIVRLPAET